MKLLNYFAIYMKFHAMVVEADQKGRHQKIKAPDILSRHLVLYCNDSSITVEKQESWALQLVAVAISKVPNH